MAGSAEAEGILPRAISELFAHIGKSRERFTAAVRVYMLELYKNSLEDLLLPEE